MRKLKASTISDYALLSLIQEVSVSPKPGLVDRFNNGSHRDMDFQSFINSSFAIKDYFGETFKIGLLSNKNDEENFRILRNLGKIAEKNMYNATKNVNTHKGTIFSLGLLTYANGKLQREKGENYTIEDICNEVKMICFNITKELVVENPKTYGEKLYFKYGFKGIRAEAEQGFEKALIGVKEYRRCRENLSKNDSLIEVLCYFLTVVEDSNVLGRGSIEDLIYVRNCGNKAIELGAMHTELGREYIYSLNDEFVKRNISPGGSADYLILTYYLHLIDNGD